MAVSDPIGVVRSLMLAKSGITTLVGTRVFVIEIPGEVCGAWEVAGDVVPTILLGPAGGEGEETGGDDELTDMSLRVQCLASTTVGAMALAEAIRAAIEGAMTTVGTNKVVISHPMGAPLPDVDEVTEWPFVEVVWRFVIG